MNSLDLEALARAAESAVDRARREILPRFRRVATEYKSDGSPVTEADRAAEQAIRAALGEATPGIPVVGEEFGGEAGPDGRYWLVDPIDGTIAFSRGIPLFATLLALVDEGEPVLGLIDLPTLSERILGWKGGGCRRNGQLLRVSESRDPRRSIIAHGDAICFDMVGRRAAFNRMAQELPFLRGYTDAFGHAQVLSGGVDAMVDLVLNPWDAAPTQVLVPEAGGRCETLTLGNGKLGLVFGSPPLVDLLLSYLEAPSPRLEVPSP